MNWRASNRISLKWNTNMKEGTEQSVFKVRGKGVILTGAMTEITHLPMGFLSLALLVLAHAVLAQLLGAEHVAQHLLAAADGLVPRALGAIAVVCRGGARGRHVQGAQLGRAVVRGRVFFMALRAASIAVCLCVFEFPWSEKGWDVPGLGCQGMGFEEAGRVGERRLRLG